MVTNAQIGERQEELNRRMDGYEETLKSLQSSIVELTKGMKMLLTGHGKGSLKESGTEPSSGVDGFDEEETPKDEEEEEEEEASNSGVMKNKPGYHFEQSYEIRVSGLWWGGFQGLVLQVQPILWNR